MSTKSRTEQMDENRKKIVTGYPRRTVPEVTHSGVPVENGTPTFSVHDGCASERPSCEEGEDGRE